MNSAMMPQDGIFMRTTIDQDTFKMILQDAEEVSSSVGYDAVANMISKLTGKRVTVNRNMTQLDDKSVVLVAKLPYRIKDPSQKGHINTEDPNNYEFCMMTYHRTIAPVYA